ncbi:CBS domain-containing protein [Bacillus sp. DNRA2]|uniref:CBS domain-containing protein n=1 Tax=Bacillus sp. DNRA2 TaxID=2723053 RepID=UPI00145E13BA|nr:CBS domain-containing protein [Bacillus sp. DNRA2]NMD69254.1 CBS domain-containing protein [Bacillus sp. DNRA2]
MKAHEMMIREVYKVKEDDTVKTVIEKFIKYRISGLPVVNDRNEIVGYISDGDVMRYIGKRKDIYLDNIYYSFVIKDDMEDFEERERRLLELNVLEIARKKIVTVDWQETIEEIAALLGNRQIKKVPVIRKGVLVGIISRGDIIRHAFKSLI